MYKILSYTIVLFGSLLSFSCDSGGGDGGSRIEASELPAPAQNFISRTFPGENIGYVERDGDTFEVFLANGVEVDFDAAGNWIEINGRSSGLPASALSAAPARAVNYARQNFDSPIVEIERESYGFDLYLANGTTLEFGPSGNFLRVD